MSRISAPVHQAGPESYAELLKRAAQRPESLTSADQQRLAPSDRRLIADTLSWHIDRTDLELVRAQRMRRTRQLEPSVRLIGAERWVDILDGFRNDTMCVSDLSIPEIRAIDNDPRLKAEFERACDGA